MDINSTDAGLRKAFRQMAPAIDATSFYQDLEAKLRGSAPRRRSGWRLAAYASVAVVLVAALTVGTLEVVKHLGNDQPVLVIGDEPTVTDEASGLYPVMVDGKWGFIDNTGTIKIEPQFNLRIGSPGFSEGLAAVAVGENNDEKWGYIDKTGAWVIEPQFDSAFDFSEGLALVGNRTGFDGDRYMKFGCIDTTGSLVIPMQYYAAPVFHEGLAVVHEGEGYSHQYFMDKTGATVLGPYEWAYDFSEGLAYVEEGGKRGFIDKNGDWVVELESAMRDVWASGSYIPATGFSEGLMVLQPTPETSVNKGYVDKTGAWVIQPQFVGAYDFSEGLAAAAIGEPDAMKWGYIDMTGAWVVQPQFDYAWDFSEGLAAVQVKGNDYSILSGYIDRTGTVVIPMQYEWASDFSGGIAQVRTPGSFDSPTYIDKTGKVIWQAK
jgi:hypothetical protein